MTVRSNMFSEPIGGIIGVVSVQDHQKIHANATLFSEHATEINIRIQIRTGVDGVRSLIEELSNLVYEIERCGRN
jgi:hypothetical protein